MGHNLDEPLRPVVKPPLPPWVSPWTGREYKGRLEWWADLNYKDFVLEKNMNRHQYFKFNEQDRYWFDPLVPDGTSISGPNGLDSTFYPNISFKGDQPGNFYEFQKKVMENSEQFKQINEKWNLSKEHPGLDVNPNLEQLAHVSFSQLGKGFSQLFPTSWNHRGPRFWDKPINEGCFEKGLCGVKYSLFATFAYTFFDLKYNPPKNMPYSWGIRCIFDRWVKHSPLPCLLAFTYNSSLCASACIRHKDDTFNFFVASCAMSLTLTTIKDNVTIGVVALLASFLLGVGTQYSRISSKGIQNRVTQQGAGLFFGPLSHKLINFGDAEVPTKKY